MLIWTDLKINKNHFYYIRNTIVFYNIRLPFSDSIVFWKRGIFREWNHGVSMETDSINVTEVIVGLPVLFLYPPGHQREVPLFTLGFLPVKMEISLLLLLVGVRPWVSVKHLEKMNWTELFIKGACNCLERALTLACWLLRWVPVPLVTLFRNKQFKSISDQPHLKISPPSWLRCPHSHMLHT